MTSSRVSILRSVTFILMVIASVMFVAPVASASSYQDPGPGYSWMHRDWDDRGMTVRVAYRAEGSAFRHIMGPMQWLRGQVPPRSLELRRFRSFASFGQDGPDDYQEPVSGVPEMGAASLFGLGLVVVYFSMRRRKLAQVS